MKKTLEIVGAGLVLCLLVVAVTVFSNQSDNSKIGSSSTETVVSTSPSLVIDSASMTPTPAISESNDMQSSWVGDYEFYETNSADQRITYVFSIVKEAGVFIAHFYIYGYQTIYEFQAKLNGDSKAVNLVFDKYLNENISQPFKEGDILFTLKMSQGNLLTYWGIIQPKLSVPAAGQESFSKMTKNEASWLVTENKEAKILKNTVIVNELENNVKGLIHLGMTRDDLTAALKENDIYYDSIESDTGGGSYLVTIYIFDDSIDIFISNDIVDGIEIRGQTPLTAAATQKGLKLGDSFETMVKLYGDDYIVTNPPHYPDDTHKVYEYKIGEERFYVLFQTDTVDGWGIM